MRNRYLVRIEHIALHQAMNQGGAQFYISCAQINVTGGSGSKTPATVSFPGAYSGTDPGRSSCPQWCPSKSDSPIGVKVNIYQTLANYTIPGGSGLHHRRSRSDTIVQVLRFSPAEAVLHIGPVTSVTESRGIVRLLLLPQLSLHGKIGVKRNGTLGKLTWWSWERVTSPYTRLTCGSHRPEFGRSSS